MSKEPISSARRIHPALTLLLGVAGLGVMGLATVEFLKMLDGFATDPWTAILPRMALSLVLFGLGFWIFTRGAAAFLKSSPPEE
jgi:hypothetical protein